MTPLDGAFLLLIATGFLFDACQNNMRPVIGKGVVTAIAVYTLLLFFINL